MENEELLKQLLQDCLYAKDDGSKEIEQVIEEAKEKYGKRN